MFKTDTEQQGFTWSGFLEQTGSMALAEGAIGAAATFEAGGVGFIPGAAIGAVTGALSYLSGLYASKAAVGLGANPKTATAIRRGFEFIPFMFNNPLVKPLEGIVSKSTGPIVKGLFEFVERTPELAKYAVKSAAAGTAVYYITEPYYEDEGIQKPLGMAALTGLGLLSLKAAEPFTLLLGYNARRLGAELLGGRRIADVLYAGPQGEFSLFGKEFSYLKGTKWRGLGIEKEKVFDIWPGMQAALYEQKSIRANVEQGILRMLEKHKEMGDAAFRDAVDFLGEAIEKANLHGYTDDEVRELLSALSRGAIESGTLAASPEHMDSLIDITMTMWGTQREIAKGLVQLGGASESYLHAIGGAKPYIAKTKVDFPFLTEVAEDELKELRKKLGGAGGSEGLSKIQGMIEEQPELFGIKEEGKKYRKPPKALRIGKESSFKERGILLREEGELSNELTTTFIEMHGRSPEPGDILLHRTEKGETLYTFIEHPTKEDKFGWFRERPTATTVSKSGVSVTFHDLVATAFNIIDSEARAMAHLRFCNYIYETGKEAKLISPDKVPGFVKLDESMELNPKFSSIIKKKFGKLSDVYVHPSVARVVSYRVGLDNYVPKIKSLATVNRISKVAYLSYNFKTWVNVFLGNSLLTALNGMSPWRVLHEYAAHRLERLGAKPFEDSLMEEATKYMETTGAVRGTAESLRREVEALKKFHQELRDIRHLPTDSGGFKKFMEPFKYITDEVFMKTYAEMHDAFRIGAYRVNFRKHYEELKKEVGTLSALSAEERANFFRTVAEKATKDVWRTYAWFEDMPIMARNIRDTVMPFGAFHFRLLPQVVKLAYRYPERFALMAVAFEGLQRAGFKETYGEDWVEGYRYEKLVNKEYEQPHLGGFMGHFIRIPSMGEIPGGYIQAHFVPWNIPVSLPQYGVTAGGANTILATAFIQNPVIRFATGWIFDVDPATGLRVSEMAGPGRAKASVLQFAMRTFVPSFGVTHYLGEYFAKEGWFDFAVSWFNYFGTYPDGTPVMTTHMLYNTLLPTVLKYDPEYSINMYIHRLNAIEQNHKKTFYKAVRRGASENILIDRLEDLDTAVSQIWQQKIEGIEAYAASQGYELT